MWRGVKNKTPKTPTLSSHFHPKRRTGGDWKARKNYLYTIWAWVGRWLDRLMGSSLSPSWAVKLERWAVDGDELGWESRIFSISVSSQYNYHIINQMKVVMNSWFQDERKLRGKERIKRVVRDNNFIATDWDDFIKGILSEDITQKALSILCNVHKTWLLDTENKNDGNIIIGGLLEIINYFNIIWSLWFFLLQKRVSP